MRISTDAPDDIHNEAVTLTKEAVPAIARASERLEDAAPLLAMPENKADNQQITASELAAVRCIVETYAVDLDRAWERV